MPIRMTDRVWRPEDVNVSHATNSTASPNNIHPGMKLT
jgi:hypothetical protein